VIVVDSSAPIAILRRAPGADALLQIIASADRCFLSAVSLLTSYRLIFAVWYTLRNGIKRKGIKDALTFRHQPCRGGCMLGQSHPQMRSAANQSETGARPGG